MMTHASYMLIQSMLHLLIEHGPDTYAKSSTSIHRNENTSHLSVCVSVHAKHNLDADE